MTDADLPVEHVLTFTAHTEPAMMVPGAPQGTRGVITVSGGEFTGPRLSGTIAPGGSDWFTARADGSLRIDARLALVCDDGSHVLFLYNGVAVPGPEGLVIRIAGLFEAPEGPHAWLNAIQAVGRGAVVEGGVRYDVFALR